MNEVVRNLRQTTPDRPVGKVSLSYRQAPVTRTDVSKQMFLCGLERKTVLNLLGTLNAVLAYAKKCGIRVPEIPAGSLVIAGDRDGTEAVYFKQVDMQRILKLAREPYRTILTLAAATGLRAGELLGLTVADVDFEWLMVCPRKQADDRTRELRELKTKRSRTPVPITPETTTDIRAYLQTHWKKNPQGLLFPNRRGRPCKRANVVKFGLWPVLKKLGISTHKAGLHAFRHGLGTALANSGASPAIVQRTLRHTDIKTTLDSTFTRMLTFSAQRWHTSNHHKMGNHYKKSRLSSFVCGSLGRGGGDRKQRQSKFQGLRRNDGKRQDVEKEQ